MTKKALIGLMLALVSLIQPSSLFALEPYPPQGYCEGTDNEVKYNVLPWSVEWYYMTTDEWVDRDDLSSCHIYQGCSYTGGGLTLHDYAEDNNCVINETDNRVRESNFIAGRKCSGSDCNGNDPIHSYTEGPANNSVHPEYNLSITDNLNAGDRIRALVYVHNTAIEDQYPANDVKTLLEWDESLKRIQAGIVYTTPNNSNYANPGVTVSSSIATLNLPNLGNNLLLEPVSLSMLNNKPNHNYNPSLISPQASGSDFIINNSSKTAFYNIGNHNSSFSNRKYIYIDFLVKAAPAPALTVEKSSTPAPGTMVNPGDNITYTITVSNTGNVDIENLIATDDLSDDLAYVSGITGVSHDGSASGGIVTANFGTLSAGATNSLSFTVQVADHPESETICNNANQVTASGEADGATVTDQPTNNICHLLPEEPEYIITKTDSLLDGAFYSVGQTFEYEITIENTGTIDIPYIEAIDELSDDLAYINSVYPLISYSSGSHTVTIPFENILVGTTVSKTFTVEVLSTAMACEDLCNIVNSDIADPPPVGPGGGGPIPWNPGGTDAMAAQTELSINNKETNIIEKIFDIGNTIIDSMTNFAKNLFTQIVADDFIKDEPIPVEKENGFLGLMQLKSHNPADRTDEFCRPVLCDQDVVQISKSSDPAPNTNVQANGIITYNITATNPTDTTITSLIVMDDLDSNLTFIGPNPSTISEITENPANSGNIELDFGSIAPFDNETLSFDVMVSSTVTNGDQICNMASYIEDGNTYSSNEICHTIGINPPGGGGGGGGGGGESNYPVGSCSAHPNGTPFCQISHINQICPSEWEECLENNNNNTDLCENEVASICAGITNNCTEYNLNECSPVEIPAPIVDTYSCVEGCRNLIADIYKDVDKSNVSVDENATYTVNLRLTNTSNENITIEPNQIKVYDLIVPADSGWLKKHILDDTSWYNSNEWKMNEYDGSYNVFSFKSRENIPAGSHKDYSLIYTMDTALTIKKDTAEVTNVVFSSVLFNMGEALYESRSNEELCNIANYPVVGDNDFFGNISSLGSTAVVQIDRPFVEVRTGANLGVRTPVEAINPFGGYHGKNSSSNSSGEEIKKDFGEYLFEEFETTGESREFFGNNFQTTSDESNVWVYEGLADINLTNNLKIDVPHTFIIKNANLIINNDFVLNNKFAAFIVENGDIVINEEVTSLEGIFIAMSDTGEIRAEEKSNKQLQISGAIMGDATKLLKKRIYIGNFVEGVLDGGLQPSVKINYDIRLLEDTPPALEAFLGEGSSWGQEY